jgi:hypothetical protein
MSIDTAASVLAGIIFFAACYYGYKYINRDK